MLSIVAFGAALVKPLPPKLPSAHCDAFTSTPYSGNPACVVLLPPSEFPDDIWMQKVANEMHLSETAFLVPRKEPSSYDLRWFTPTDEVDLCGHATLASSSVLWEVHGAPLDIPIKFYTRSGLLSASRDAAGVISLDFPAEPADQRPSEEYTKLLIEAFGLRGLEEVVWVGRNAIGGPGGGDLIVEVTPAAFARLAPMPSAITKAGSLLECRVLSVTCAGCPPSVPLPVDGPDASDYDFTSRGFAPCVGVDEDPVCGSAHCALGPYWASKLGKTELLARVASPRGGDVRVDVRGDRVSLGGNAVVTMTGELLHTVC
jgi:PhzF family phenazine biosynthesis protein